MLGFEDLSEPALTAKKVEDIPVAIIEPHCEPQAIALELAHEAGPAAGAPHKTEV
jgi:hypothetical protein